MATKKSDVRSSAKALARLGARRGGEARAAVLSAEERREIARKAVLARWRKQKGEAYDPPAEVVRAPRIPELVKAPGPPRAKGLHSLMQGRLPLGTFTLQCHHLSDGTRVFEMPRASRKARPSGPSALLDRFLSAAPRAGGESARKPVTFRIAGNPKALEGRDALQLVHASEAYLEARERDVLSAPQQVLAKQAEQLVRACASQGVVYLFDGATGHRELRARMALRNRLLGHIAHDLQGWSRVFPEQFWKELARLEGVRYLSSRRPIRWGKYVIFFLHDAVRQEIRAGDLAATAIPHGTAEHQAWLDDFVERSFPSYMRQVLAEMRGCKNTEEFNTRFVRVFSNFAALLAVDELEHISV